MNAEEVRQYARELQHANEGERALGPLNKWLLQRCVKIVNKDIKKAVRRGREYYTAVFTVNAPHALQDKDKLFLAEYYKSQGYHVELRFHSMDISWAEERPWWFRNA